MIPTVIDGMHGLGDNLYQRAVLRHYHPEGRLYLQTSWPQLYADMPHVHPIRKPNVTLRTQAKNAATADGFHAAPEGRRINRKLSYVRRPGSILEALCASLEIRAPARFDMTGPPVNPVRDTRYVVVRPATVRTEWRADARNPRPEYIARAAEAAQAAGFSVISVADLKEGEEWALEPLPPADVTLHRGELSVMNLLEVIAGAAGVIGGVGFLTCAALAYNVPQLLIFGGWGHDNHPGRILGPGLDTSRIVQAVPDPMCMCHDGLHDCPRSIAGMDRHIAAFLDLIGS